MNQRLRLHTANSVQIADGRVILHNPNLTLTLEGEEVCHLARSIVPQLDGTKTGEEITEQLQPQSPNAATEFIAFLQRFGLLAESVSHPDSVSSQFRLLSLLGIPVDKGMQRLDSARLIIAGLEPWGGAAVAELAAAGVRRIHLITAGDPASETMTSRLRALDSLITRRAPWCDISVSPLSDFRRCDIPDKEPWTLLLNCLPFFDGVSQNRVSSFGGQYETPILSATVKGSEILIGPYTKSRGGPCWHCMSQRMLGNQDPFSRSEPSLLDLSAETAGPFSLSVSLGPSAYLGGALIATEVMKWLLGIPVGWLDGTVMIYNSVTAGWTTHKVIPLPWCKFCGGVEAILSNSIQESGAQDPAGYDSIESLKRKFSGWIDPRVGMISELAARETNGGITPPPYFVRALLAHQTNGQKLVGGSDHCGGKGYSEGAAALAALGEAIERYSAAVIRPEWLRRAAIVELSPGDVIDPRQLCLYEEEQYRSPSFPCAPFDPDRPYSWIKGRWIHNGEEVWVPAAAAFYSRIEEDDPQYCQTTSNALAAGQTFEDAAVRAVYELLERDALMVTWIAKRPARRIILDAGVEPEVLRTINKLRDLGGEVEVYILDVDSPVTTAACFTYGDGVRWPGLTVGSAAHLDPLVAVRNAVLEQAFSGLAYKRIMADGGFKIPEKEEVRTFLDHGLFYIPRERNGAAGFLRDSPELDLTSFCWESTAGLARPLSTVWPDLACALKRSGLKVAVVDVTAPDVRLTPFKVVRALGPDIQPLWCGFGMERVPCSRALKLMAGPPNPDLHPVC